jgi:Asp-tRNA(Asn)/Glu-tRNA(Gln) amidotransferase A subunit family amidase
VSINAKPVLGIPVGPYLERASAAMLRHFQAVAERLRSHGFIVKSVPAMADFDAIYVRHFRITNGEAARVHRDWFPRYRELYHPKTVEKLEEGLRVSDAALDHARLERAQFIDVLTGLMQQHGVDVWISPSAVDAAPEGLSSTGDPVMNLPWSQAGFPVLSLPSGADKKGLPLGLQLTAAGGDDERLLQWAAQIESALANHR